MHLDWILSPITCYATVALALLGCLVLFVTTKLEVQAVRRLAISARAELEEMQRQSPAVMHSPSAPVPDPEPAPAQLAQPVLPQLAGSLNLSKRAQALRMHRRGEPVPSIAAALQSSQGEIQLLLKVHTLMNAKS
jgi:hypothetical protein